MLRDTQVQQDQGTSSVLACAELDDMCFQGACATASNLMTMCACLRLHLPFLGPPQGQYPHVCMQRLPSQACSNWQWTGLHSCQFPTQFQSCWFCFELLLPLVVQNAERTLTHVPQQSMFFAKCQSTLVDGSLPNPFQLLHQTVLNEPGVKRDLN